MAESLSPAQLYQRAVNRVTRLEGALEQEGAHMRELAATDQSACLKALPHYLDTQRKQLLAVVSEQEANWNLDDSNSLGVVVYRHQGSRKKQQQRWQPPTQ